MPGVFAGGDCARAPASVIQAIAAAKVVAANIDEYLGYGMRYLRRRDPGSQYGRPAALRTGQHDRAGGRRSGVCDFEAVENCMTEKEAHQEAGRCLRCDHFGYGIFKGGREKLW